MLKRQYLLSFTIDDHYEEEYLGRVPAIRYLNSFTFKKPVTFFVGENGSGKSTLLEALAVCCGFNAEGGTRNFNFSTRESHSSLYKSMHIARSMPFPSDGFFLRAESYYNVATEIERIDKINLMGEDLSQSFIKRNYGGRSPHEQSHGESFMALAINRFKKKSLFFLDEPEAALSPSRQMTLLARIHELVMEDCQFVIATHSPLLMAYPEAEIVELTDSGAKVTPYRETEHYRITRHFLEKPEAMLRYLLNDDDGQGLE